MDGPPLPYFRVRVLRRNAIQLIAWFVVTPGLLLPQGWSQTTSPQQNKVVFEGEVRVGEGFAREIAPGLFFYLRPTDGGWSITIAPVERCQPEDVLGGYDDFVYVVTPPYRFQNAQALNTQYQTPAREAVGYPRMFQFVTHCEAFEAEMQRVQFVLWPGTVAPERLEDARARLGQDADGNGRLEILDSRIDESVGKFGVIEWIRFRVELELGQ